LSEFPGIREMSNLFVEEDKWDNVVDFWFTIGQMVSDHRWRVYYYHICLEQGIIKGNVF
jgi:hypothetical protein